ncbi:class I SAM-dependent methyltransferase [Sphingomonas qilianensis]|uniref:Class I SAM-dependent methyltransferase n=1 Tax=Sphingomonas qilianensis TaxID=1736690 RepID=A0ABU9XP22_9SPHN
MDLPKFADRPHNKLTALSDAIVAKTHIQQITWAALKKVSTRVGRPARVLDFGCGIGGTVAVLRNRGYDAYGVDVVESYIDNGSGYFVDEGEYPALSLLKDGRSIFPDSYFDLVISDQVLEHVEQVDAVASEISRITAPGGEGVHIFPAKYCFKEPHMYTPIVHWLPKGAPRKAAIKTMLRLGYSAPFFSERPLDERTEIFNHYSETETFYRSSAELRRVFARHGLTAASGTREKLKVSGGTQKKVAAMPLVGGVAATLYDNFRASYLVTRNDTAGG